MSISGNLEDVSGSDVMQFIHLGRRTGTLVMVQGEKRAMVGFYRGKLISARGDTQPLVGDMLVRRGVLDPERLRHAINLQNGHEEKRTLGAILLAQGDVDAEALREAVFDQIKQTINEIVQWHDGRFEFVVDDLRPVDDISLYPGDVLEDSDLNTQMVLMEAARIFDERNRRGSTTGSSREDSTRIASSPSVRLPHSGARTAVVEPAVAIAGGAMTAQLERVAEKAPFPSTGDRLATQAAEVRVVTSDEVFFARCREALRWLGAHVCRVEPSVAGMASAERTPLILFDLRHVDRRVSDLRAVCRACSDIPVVALVDEGFPLGEAYGAGAVAALPADPDAVAACVGNLLHNLLNGRSARSAGRATGTEEMARLRRVFGDLRSGLISATVALNLMHIISESVERAVLFLVRRNSLAALGAFGETADGRPLAELTRNLRIQLDEESGLSQCVRSGEARSFAFDEVRLPAGFVRTLGEPLTGQSVIFPILGTQKVIAAIYADNGRSGEAIEDIEILELAAAQVGMAFENELLRHQIAEADR